MNRSSKISNLTLTAMLTALNIILSRFVAIDPTSHLRVSFGFIPTAAAGMLLGPASAMIVGGLSDVLGFLLKPTGSYHFGFTLTAILSGLVYGLFFYKRRMSLWQLLLARFVVVLCLNLGLNTLWLQMLQGKAYMVILPSRAVTSAIRFPIDVVFLFATARLFKRIPLFHLRKE